MQRGFQWSPALLTLLSFLALIAAGTLLLLFPASNVPVDPIRFIDALFTATSAVCVTGLIVQDTPNFFTFFGQTVILILIQLGGLGIMTLSAGLPIIFGKQVKISRRDLFQSLLDQSSYANLRDILHTILRYTFIIEGIGALILTARWYWLWGDFKKALYFGVFHSVSAFCNAGFALFSDSLIPFRHDPIINLTIMILIVLGGLGFVVIHQIIIRKSFRKLELHSRLVLILTAIFILFPALFFFFVEYTHSFLTFGFFEKVGAAFFHSVTARTAGFNTVDITQFSNATIFLITILMFVGGAPGGTAGGVKVTTVGVLLLSIRSLLFRREDIEISGRSINRSLVTKVIAIVSISFLLVTFFILMLLLVEKASFVELFFEMISAFGTVGLSLGVTPHLSDLGKLLISAMMLIGRIGPLTLVYILSTRNEKIYYQFPKERVMVA